MSNIKHKRGEASALGSEREAELNALARKPDADIDYSDIPGSGDEQWSDAVRGKFYRPLKTQASVRIDADVMAWLKLPGKGYQTRLNAILREAMLRDLTKNSQGRLGRPWLIVSYFFNSANAARISSSGSCTPINTSVLCGASSPHGRSQSAL